MEHKWIIPVIVIVFLVWYLRKKYVQPTSTATV